MDEVRQSVAVVYNEPVLPPDHPDAASEADVVNVAEAVAGALEVHGFIVELVAAGPPLDAFLARLQARPPDVIFNLLEGFGGRSDGEAHLTSLFELLELPYTGSPATTLGLCISKSRTKAILKGSGLPTAPWVSVGPGERVHAWEGGGLVIVKPDAEDGSIGIDQSSVVDNTALIDRVERLRSAYGGRVLIESYLAGTEFNIGVLALPQVRALPVARVNYDPNTGLLPIMTYAAKWDPTSAEDRASVVECPANIDAQLAADLSRIAERAFVATGCRDYARVDIRLDGEGRPMVLEVNANPDIGPTAGLARAIRSAGRDHAETLAAITRTALARRHVRG